MKGVVVVGVVPVERARRHKALFVGARHEFESHDRGFLHLRVVEVQLAILGDDVLAATGDQEIIEQLIGVVAVCGHLKAQAVDVAQSLFAQLFLHVFEEIIIGVPGLRDVLDLVAGLLDQ